jgi:hypothetical protein
MAAPAAIPMLTALCAGKALAPKISAAPARPEISFFIIHSWLLRVAW